MYKKFCKVRACRFSVKTSIFQKLVEMFLLMSPTNNFAKKYFLTHFEIVQNFHYFVRSDSTKFSCKVRTYRFSVKNSIFQKFSYPFWDLKCCRNVSFDECHVVEQIILPKNIFLPHFEIVQNFHYFVRSAPVDIPSKIQFSKNCPKFWRNVSFDQWNI